jgi:hypothetical protein
MSVSANAGPFGVTIGGGRKRRSNSSTERSSYATDSSYGYNYVPMSAAEALVWEVVARVEEDLGPDPLDENARLDSKVLIGLVWAAWLIFWMSALDSSNFTWSAWTWISLAGLTFTQVMTSPSARYVSISRRWSRGPSRRKISELILSTWATARTIPAMTALPFLLLIAISHLVAISEFVEAPRGTVTAIFVYALTMPLLTVHRVRRVDENPEVAKDAVMQNFRNTFLLTYSVNSRANAAKLKRELEWTVQCLDEIEKTAASRNCPLEENGYSDFQRRERRLRTELAEIESFSSATKSDTKRRALKTLVLRRVSGIYDSYRPRTRAEQLHRQALEERALWGDELEEM